MDKMKWSNIQIFTLLFFISPLLSFPLIIYYVYHGKRYAYTFLALFLGFIALLYAPTHDLFRHNLFYYDCVSSVVDNGVVFKQDLILYTLTAWFAKWNINFEFIRFLFVFISYQLYFLVYLSLQEKNGFLKNSRSTSFFLFLLLLFSIRFFVICCGLRQGMATALAIYGAYVLLVENRKIAYLFLVLAPLTHLSLLLLSLSVLLIKINVIRFNFKIGLSLAVILYWLSLVLMGYLASILGGDVGNAIEVYTTGYWGSGGEAEGQISFNGLVASSFNKIQMLPLLYFLYKMEIANRYYSFVIVCFIFCAVTLPYFAVVDRMIMLFVTSSIIYFLKNYNGSQFHGKIAKVEFVLVAIFFSISLYAERGTMRLSREYKLLAPVPYIMSNNFSEQWLWENMDNWRK